MVRLAHGPTAGPALAGHCPCNAYPILWRVQTGNILEERYHMSCEVMLTHQIKKYEGHL